MSASGTLPLSAVNSSSQHVRNFYITFLLAGIYIAIIIWSTTDMMLLKETPVNLPLLNAELPITGFYRFAPFFYLLVHFNLLLQLCLLSDKLHSYNAVLSKLEDKEAREYYDIRLFPFVSVCIQPYLERDAAFRVSETSTHSDGMGHFDLVTSVFVDWFTSRFSGLSQRAGAGIAALGYRCRSVYSNYILADYPGTGREMATLCVVGYRHLFAAILG